MQDARILVVEDEPQVAQDIRINLEALGFSVAGCVDSGEAAVDLAGRTHPDLVLMDIVLSGPLDGIEAARLIGTEFDIPVVYLTAYADQEFLDRAKVTDPLGYILKPYTRRELQAVITLALYRARTERKLQNLFWGFDVCSSVEEAVITVDPELRISLLNPAAIKMLGVDADKVIGKKWSPSLLGLAPLAKYKITHHLKQAIAAGERWHVDDAIELDFKGRRVFLAVSVGPVLRRERIVLGAMLILRDVTARKSAELNEADLRAQLQQYLDVTGAMMVAIDPEGRVVLANPAACEVLGYPEQVILGQDWFKKFIPKRVRSEARAVFTQVLADRDPPPQQIKVRVLTRSGEERIVVWNLATLRDAESRIVAVLGSGLDFTEHRRLEIAVERSRDFYLSLLDRLPVLVWRSDVSGLCDYFNGAWLDFTGRSLEEEVGDGWTQGVHPDDLQRCLNTYQDAFGRREPFSMEYRLRHRDGTYHMVLTIGQPISDLQGEFSGYIGGCVDIDIKQRVEIELRRTSRALHVLSAANESLVRAENADRLLQEICDIIVSQGGYRMAWMGLVENDSEKSIRPVAASGVAIKDIAALRVGWGNDKQGMGPTGRAIRDGAAAVMRQITEPEYEPWKKAASRFGYASSTALPIKSAGRVIGALNIYATEPDAFDEDELKLMTNLAEDLSFGLNALQEQHALKVETGRNQTILKTAQDGFLGLDLEGRVLDVNDAYCAMTGYSREELLAKHFVELEPKESLNEAKAHLATIIEQGSHRFEARHLTKFGSQLDLEINATQTEIDGAEYIFAFLRDVSERKRTERMLLESETKHRALFEMAQDAIFLLHEDKFVDCNARALAMFTGSLDQIIGQSLGSILEERQRDGRTGTASARELADRAFSGESLFVERTCRKFDGTSFEAEIALNRIRIAGVSYLQAIIRDITERVRADRDLLDAYERLRALYEASPDMIFMYGADGNLLEVNDHALKGYGYSRHEILGLSLDDLSGQQVDKMQAQKLLQSALQGEAQDFEWIGRRKSGAEFPIEVRLRRLGRDESIASDGVAVIAVVRDLSERKAAESALRESESYNRMLFQQSPVGLVLTRMGGELVDVNPEFLRIVGYTLDEVLKLSSWDITPESYSDRERQQLEDLRATGRYGSYEKEFVHKDGRRVPVRLNGLLIEKDEDTYIWSSIEDISETKAAEQALISARANLEDAQRIAHIGSWEWDLIGDSLAWSPEVYRIFEMDPVKSEPSYDAFMRAVHPDDRALVEGAYEKSVSEQTPYSLQHRLLMEDGRIKYVYERGETYYDKQGSPLRSLGTVQDISERVLVEQSLKRERDFSATVLDTIGSVVVVLNREGRIIRFNHAAQMLTGYGEAEMLGTYVWDRLLVPEQVDPVRQVFATLTSGQFPNQYVNFWVTRAGERRLIDWSNNALIGGDGGVDYVIATGIDITAKQQAEEGLEAVETEWNLAIDFFADPIYFVDMEDRVVRANAAFYKFTGQSPERVIGHDITAIMHPNGEEKPCPVCAARHAREDAVIVMEADQPQNPMKRPVEVTVRMIRKAPDDDPVGMLMTLRDLTRQRQIEEELRRHRDHLEELVHARTQALATVNKELEAFSYSVSHDLRAPLRRIDGFSQVLLEDYAKKLDDRGRDYLTRVRNGSQRMSQLIDDLLMLSRVTRNDMHRQKVDLSEIARQITDALQEGSPQRQVQVDIQPRLYADADPRLIRILLENLFGNAWKFTSTTEHAQIAFSQEEDDGELAFVVSDNGVGFDMAFADGMFMAFQRLHADQDFEGSGVGLATVQRIVRRHGGRVYARGEPGVGARLYFTLPTEKGLVSSE